MASFDTTRPMADGHLYGARPSTLFARIHGAIAAWNDARVTRNALSKLSDHELEDLGLSRGDIDAMAGNLRRF
ncbi:MAG: DUF1127 domain-containing protein [Paracoccaceae bacterium]|nr:DUF1127 domain-containing protein [Paracoccaceae bacterium]